ncbi:3-hydroxyacyl-CoA dehydrogenase family protein [Serratia ureilytica]|uniref:3-hydroxyacyl-CoA dehydrogenase family protein n=1 Tax=Serratia ureilytica TaxID=300181 RepID=UPI0011CB1DFE|nr:3-hydroxyacyl-CoA dehydrogenase family protein [Serratia ureilytica]TXE59586.1 3-hydroxyacyl-CoA dehydrogenase family protein [Serratia ureilytica]
MQSSDYAVLGAGLMGVGIATHFIRHGHEVLLYEPDPQRRVEAPTVASGILAELSVTGDLNAVARARLLIEAIPERLELKHALYEQLEGLIADDAVIASNTSGLPPDELAARMTHPQRLLIAHFWHPPHLIPLVEIVPGRATEPRHLAAVQALLGEMALEAVLLERAAPGFVGNRLQFAVLREALHIVHSGIASAEVVDQVMRASLGRRYAMVGPLEAADMTGLATVADIARHLFPELATGDEMMALVEQRLQRGDIGQRSGRGFYLWDEARRERIQRRRAHQLRFALKP